jgi:4-hydroxy-tetrahydrodipicolinate synthase
MQGIVPIAVMPFNKEGVVDQEELSREITFLVEIGIEWVGFGFGSEVHTLSETELVSTLTHAVKVANNQINVIGNVEMNSTLGAISRIKLIKETGCAMAMVRPAPSLASAPEKELIAAFTLLAEKGNLPIVIQDAPGNSGVNLSAAMLVHLLENVKNIESLKIEPLAPAIKIGEIIRLSNGKRCSVIGGSGGIDFIHELKRGAVGTMPGPAFPEIFREIQHRMESGDEKSARTLFAKVLPLIVLSGRDMSTFLFAQKYILQKRGVLKETYLRTPHGVIDPVLPKELDEMLNAINFESILKECS